MTTAAFGALLTLHAVLAQDTVGHFRFPTEPIGPRVVALGGGGVAESFDAEATLNPATLAGAHRASLHRFEGYSGYNGFVLAATVPVRRWAVIGVSVRHFDYGDVIQDDLGPGTDDLDVREEAFAGTVTFQLNPRLSVGATLSHLSATYFGSTTAANALSLGAVVSPASGTRIGLALRELGASARSELSGTRYPLPSRLRVGLAQLLQVAGQDFTVLGDGEMAIHGRADPSIYLGTEWRPIPLFSLRLGYANAPNPDVADDRGGRWSGGAGIDVGAVELGAGARFGGSALGTELFIGLDAFR